MPRHLLDIDYEILRGLMTEVEQAINLQLGKPLPERSTDRRINGGLRLETIRADGS